MTLLRLFTHNLLPIFLAAGLGYLVAARTKVSPRPLATVAFTLFSPCLVFRIIVENRVSGIDFLRMAGFTLVGLVGLGLLAALVARRLGWPRPLAAAVVLTVLLPNAGNLGLSAELFAFGQPGLTQGSLYFVSASIVTYTLGVLVASMGRTPLRHALAGLLRVPTVWAVPAAFLLVELDLPLPIPAERTLDLLADACIPVFLIVLGMQLRGAIWRGQALPVVIASALRLGGGIAAGFLLAPLFGLEGAARQAGILEAAMPSAVITTILATEYDVEPAFVTTVVLTTTLLSPFTLTPLIAILGG
jgi:hypothetical protein